MVTRKTARWLLGNLWVVVLVVMGLALRPLDAMAVCGACHVYTPNRCYWSATYTTDCVEVSRGTEWECLEFPDCIVELTGSVCLRAARARAFQALGPLLRGEADLTLWLKGEAAEYQLYRALFPAGVSAAWSTE